MNMRWSLKELYPDFESNEFKQDMEKCKNSINEIKQWVSDNLQDRKDPKVKIEKYLNMTNSFSDLFSGLSNFAELTLSVEAKNETALIISDKLDQLSTELTEPNVIFQKWLSSLEDIEDVINTSENISDHSFYIRENIKKSKYLLTDKEEILMSKMKNTGSNAWSKLQELLTSTLLVEINIDGEDKQLPLPVVRNMAYDGKQEVRKTAYEAELKSYKKIEESSAASLNGIKGEVLTTSKMRGLKSPLEKTIIDSRMDENILDAMLSAIKESLPSFHKFYRKKAELLGYKEGLPFYELFAPVGSADMQYSYDQAREFIVSNFKTFSGKLANFADNAFEKKWIDAEIRDGKRGGAFCANLHSIKESRILANFTGSFNDVTTLAHELGHGYHGDQLKDETYLNSHYPMPLAETASIFSETIVKNAAIKEAEHDQALYILENDLSDAGQVIVDIYSRFLFESKLFELREEGYLSVNKLKEIMLEAQKTAYGNGLDHNYLHPYMWLNKPHYYYAGYNFYNFPYAFGLLFAKGLYVEYLNRGESFVEEYDKLLSATGKMDIIGVAKLMNIDVTSKDFWQNSLKLVEQDIETFVNMK